MNDRDLIGTHQLKTFPRNRRFIIDTLEQGARKHRVYGLVELDVTRGRQVLRELKGQRGERVSFTAWIVKCIAQAVSEHKHVNAYRHGRGNVVVFDDVDVVVAVERFVDGESINYPLSSGKPTRRRWLRSPPRSAAANQRRSPPEPWLWVAEVAGS